MKRLFPLLAILLIGASFVRVFAETEDFAAAVSAGKVSVNFHGTGGSSGDSIEATIVATPNASGDLVLTIAPGTRLQSGSALSQNMVIAGVKGQMINETNYLRSSVIQVDDTNKTYVLDAYCTDFEKENPSSDTKFTLGNVDPILACILSEAANLSPQAKQAAVWIYTEKATFSHVKQKFKVRRSDWKAAAAIVKKCSAQKPGS